MREVSMYVGCKSCVSLTGALVTRKGETSVSASCAKVNSLQKRSIRAVTSKSRVQTKGLVNRGLVTFAAQKESTIEDEIFLDTKGSLSPLVDDAPPSKQGKSQPSIECVGGGMTVECLVDFETVDLDDEPTSTAVNKSEEETALGNQILDNLLLVSPFFFWGTAMVAMKVVLPHTAPLFVASMRLIPAGFLLIGYALAQNRKSPDSAMAWFAISMFAIVDAAFFQGFLARGLQTTSAGLGSVIIDSQPISVAILASILFGERIGGLGVFGLSLGVFGLLLLELPAEAASALVHLDFSSVASGLSEIGGGNGGGLWESGEWWMLLAAQSMAVGTVMVRWVSKYVDPVMATGWHLAIGGLPLLALSLTREPELYSHLNELSGVDWVALAYTSIFGGAVGYGVFFYFASKGNLTRLSSLTFLTPMFAALFGYLFLDEVLTPTQLLGAAVTLGGITLVGGGKTEDKKNS